MQTHTHTHTHTHSFGSKDQLLPFPGLCSALTHVRHSCGQAQFSLTFQNPITPSPPVMAFLPNVYHPVTSPRYSPVVPPNQLGSQSKPHCKAVRAKARGYIILISRSPTDSKQLLTTSSFFPSEEIITIATNIPETKADKINTVLARRTPGLKCNLKIKSNNFPPFEHTWNKISI